MIQNKWISQVSPIQLIDELHEFITLWEGVSTVNHVENSDDEIKRKWTPNGQYTTQSVYQIQFMRRLKKLVLIFCMDPPLT
jgi:hypothetical protein